MKFSCNKEISYEEAVKTMFEKLGNAQIMALASSLNDYVMVRNVSCLFMMKRFILKQIKIFVKQNSFWKIQMLHFAGVVFR